MAAIEIRSAVPDDVHLIGTFIRGPGWLWFNLGQTWDHHRVDHQINRDLHELFGIAGTWPSFFFGLGFLLAFGGAIGLLTHLAFKRFTPDLLKRMSKFQYVMMMQFWVLQALVVAKVVARLGFTVKYFWVTPWFNV